MKNKVLLSILFNSCISFTIISLLINLFFHLMFINDEGTNLPNIGITFTVLLVSLIIATAIALLLIKLKKELIISKIYVIYYITCLFTSLFIVLNLSTVVIKNIWNIYTILMIFLASVFVGIVKYLIPINQIFKAILYFFIYAVPYFVIVVKFAGYGQGNKLIIVITLYVVFFALVYSFIQITKTIIRKHKNKSEEYKNLFK